jgi:hypothetical protein
MIFSEKLAYFPGKSALGIGWVGLEEVLIVGTITVERFRYVQEWDDAFLALFPHRYDYIWAEHPDPQGKLEWKTESRHPLSDRLIRQGAYVYGVRFGAETNYYLLDIDAGSIYHPKRDPFAISRILAALEPLGLVSYVACTSSYSGGIHLYFPFEQAQKSWQLALVVQTVLENAGFKPGLGQLELFPNCKPYVVDGAPNLYAAHRLPMQSGSYLLNPNWELVHSHQPTFVEYWQFARNRNQVQTRAIAQILKTAQRKHFSLSGKADKFLNDLNADIEPGWTDYGQTNYLLGRITLRGYIFGHLLNGCQPLEGQALVDYIITTAKSLPGYAQWCRHQHEIVKRAEEWALCIENSHYFHFGISKSQNTPENPDPDAATAVPSWNQRQSEAARERIRVAIADLLNQNSLPSNATARFQALTQYGIGGGSLYRHRDLWHPNHLSDEILSSELNSPSLPIVGELSQTPEENPPDPPTQLKSSQVECVEDAPTIAEPTSLLHNNDRNPLSTNDSSPPITPPSPSPDRNSPPLASSPALSPSRTPHSRSADAHDGSPLPTPHSLPHPFPLETWQAINQEASQIAHENRDRLRHEASQAALIARMQQFLDSNDPILVAEAIAWAKVNPGLLQIGTQAEIRPDENSKIQNDENSGI